MTKPASAPDVIPPREQPQPVPPGQREGTNETLHEPDPKADPLPSGDHKHVPRSPFIHGND